MHLNALKINTNAKVPKINTNTDKFYFQEQLIFFILKLSLINETLNSSTGNSMKQIRKKRERERNYFSFVLNLKIFIQ